MDCRLTLLILGLLAENAVTELRWGLLSTFPRPMPVTSSAQVFPRLFTVNNTLKLPVLHLNNDTRPVESNRTILLNGTLCFQITPTVDPELSPCVGLFPQEAVWSDRLNFTSKKIRQLRLAIASVNSTSVDPAVLSGLSKWLHDVTTWFSQWGGLTSSTVVFVLVIILLLYCVCKLRRRQDGYMLLTQQALFTLQEGGDPQVWFQAMEDV
ncbi:uncharacterized protein [Petaurus breviceps papuanus]|uniref:uncharacterized protein n=1 Tax=Petaurus breviceps papuanus TaxID=3040969 RepID=UPI0036D76EB1